MVGCRWSGLDWERHGWLERFRHDVTEMRLLVGLETGGELLDGARPKNRYSKPHTERAAPRCLFSHTKLWEKVPGHLLFFAQTAETRRHRSTAADLGRLSLVCLFQPRPSRSRPSIFSSAGLQPLTFPGRRPHGRRYESALWLLGAGALHSAVGSCSMVVQPLVGLDWGRHG